MTTRLFFDIETRANPAALAHLPEPEAPANYKDAAKIAACIAEKKAQQAAQAALDPDTGCVSSIAYQAGLNGVPQIRILAPITSDATGPVPDNVTLYVYADPSERDHMEHLLLEHFWSAFARADGVCCGYNVIAFDLPFLLRRSMALQVPPPSVLPVLAKYRLDPARDLFGLLYQWGPGKGLKTVAQLYELPNELPGLTGADVAAMDWRTEAAYAVNDLQLLIALYRRMAGFYWPIDADREERP